MATRAAAILAKVVRIAQADTALSDRDLLARYADSGDQAAFAAVVRRHTDMIHGVCRRLLQSQADAEDACQAVFLILSKKAKSQRWRESVANWLYITARKVAHNARLAAKRRARREGAAAKPELVSPADTISGRELVIILDEELEKLAPRYREPLVLCYLEGLTRDEAAARLGVPEATLKSQLERGRKKLAEALTARECTLGVALLATATTSLAGKAPPRLVESILTAVGGSPSTAAAALVKGIAMNGTIIRAKLMTLAMAATVAVVGFGFSTLLPVAAKSQKQSAEKPEKPQAKAEVSAEIAKPEVKERVITGKVLSPDGKPIVAELHLIWIDDKPESLGKTAADGTFKVTVPIKTPGAYLVAKADGHGIDFMMPATNTPAEITLKLSKDLPIRGRIIDPQGKPVVGATVQLRTVSIYGDGSIQSFLDAWKKRTNFREVVPERRVVYNTTALPFGTSTDRNGRFELSGGGAERLVSLKISGAGRAETEVHVITREGFEPKPYNNVTLSLRPTHGEKLSWSYNPMLSAPDFTVAAEGEKPIRGRLTDAKTGLPRAGVQVIIDQDDDISRRRLKATTDADGKYEIHGAQKSSTYQVDTKTDATNGYLPCSVEAKDTVGYEPVVTNIACPKGVVVKGTIRDKATGQPIAGCIQIAVLADNPYLKNYATRGAFADRTYTKADGAYRVVMIPGPMLLLGGTDGKGYSDHYKPARPDPKYPQLFKVDDQDGELRYYAPGNGQGFVDGNWCKVIDAKETDTELVQDIELEPAPKKLVKVVDVDGKPLKGVHATGISHITFLPAEPIGESDSIIVLNLEPKQERLVVAMHRERKLVGAMKVKEADENPVLKLGPGGTAKGRVVDTDGKPIAGITVKLYFERREVAEIYNRRVTSLNDNRTADTDVDGKFEFDTLAPGFQFRFLFSKGKMDLGPDNGKAPRATIGKHGEIKNVGELKIDLQAERTEE